MKLLFPQLRGEGACWKSLTEWNECILANKATDAGIFQTQANISELNDVHSRKISNQQASARYFVMPVR